MQQKTPIPRSTFAPIVVTLACGIPLAYDHVPSVESCALGIWVRAGTRDEPRGQAGVAHLVEHTSFRRTSTRTNHRIAREFENVGAYANAYTTKEETCYYVRTLTDHLHQVLPTLADVVLNPVFAPGDIDKERDIVIEEIKAYEDEAEESVYDLAELELFGPHALGNPILGTVESVQHISSEQVKSFHERRYHAGSMVLAVSGNIEPQRFIDLANHHLAHVRPRKRTQPRSLPSVTKVTNIRQLRPTQQAHILWHTRTPGQRSEQRSALTLLNVILGDGMSSRLHVRLRDASGLAYNINSQVQLFTDVGTFSVYAGTEARRENKVAHTIERELASLARDGVKPIELRRAKEQAKASRIMSLESLSARMSLLGKGLLDDGTPEDPYAAINEIMAVTKEEIDAVAREVCRPEVWHRLTLLPSAP